MPEALTKKYGPLKGWQWLLVVIGGIGLGLLIRSQLKGGSGPITPAQQGTNNLPATQGAPTIVQEPAESTIALQKEFDRFREELDERQKTESKEPVDSGGSNDERQDETGVRRPQDETGVRRPGAGGPTWMPIIIPDGPEDNSEPKRKVREIITTQPKPKVDYERQKIKTNIRNIFQQEELKPPSSSRLNRLADGVERWNAGDKTTGRSYASIREGLQNFKANQ